MKNKLFRNLFTLSLALFVALVFAACTPEVHIHTGDGSTEAIASDNANTDNNTNVTKPEVDTSVASSENSNTTSPKKESSTPSNATSSSTTISKSKAKSIALKDAGLKESQIYDYEIELDRDNGALHYDVSFESGGKDYDYEINAKTGKIISVEKPNATASAVKVSKATAKSTALKHAGVKSADISRYQIELEKDDGVWKYELSFNVGYTEYEYTINAENGKILHSEKEIDD
ncbi:MAG: hypothetical protein E7542_01020 [Ruminococcaceae bacterium]|nr:hypothetical protein [Oscillospiraceae bacterium]